MMIVPNTIDDGIKVLSEKIIGLLQAQEAMRFLPQLEGVEYWGTDTTICISLTQDQEKMVFLSIKKLGWYFINPLWRFSHPCTKIELVIYFESDQEKDNV